MGTLPDIETTFYIEAAPSRVFAALTDSNELVKWWPVKAMIDNVEGGRFSLTFKNGFVMEGKLSGFKVNSSVSFSWVEGTASFKLLKTKGGTLLRLHHIGFVTPEALWMSSGGWSYYLTNLKSVLGHGVDLRAKQDRF
jgi:uncharacterized protein YndB with AHSA1/START domain